MSPRDLALLLFLALLWGSSFLLMRVAGPEFGAAPLAFVRVAVATAFLGVLLAWRREPPDLAGRGPRMALMAITNTAAPFFLLTWATIHLSAGYGSLLNATTPLWGALIGALLFASQRAGRAELAGLVLGFVGVGVLVSGKLAEAGQAALWPVLAGLLATACYGFAAHFARGGFSGMSPLALAFGSQLGSSLLLAGPAVAHWPDALPGPLAWACVVVLGVACTGLAYLIYFGLIARIGATRATMVTYLAPVAGVAMAALVLGEAITPSMLAGGAIVLLGVAVANQAWKAFAAKA
jgi:drug/metabolite transporter (DMT)-like permease